jgi:hypothetical protein
LIYAQEIRSFSTALIGATEAQIAGDREALALKIETPQVRAGYSIQGLGGSYCRW